MIKIINWCKNNSEKSSTTKIGQHIHCEYSISMIWTFDGKGNRNDKYRGEDCMKKYFESLREHVIEISNFEKKKMIPSTKEQYDLYLYQIKCHFWKQKFEHNWLLNTLLMKTMTLKTIVNTEDLLIIYVLWNATYLKKFLWFFLMNWATIIILL